MMDVRKTLESSYAQLCILFVVAVLLKELSIIASNDINFMLFVYILPLFCIPALLGLKNNEQNDNKKIPRIWLILLILALFIFIVRIIPYFHTQVPLGYDPGFYKYAIETYIDNLPHIPESTLPGWLKSMYPQGLFILTDMLYIFAGYDAMQFFKIFFPFLCALLILPVFILTRQLFNERCAVIAALLYAISYTQYTMFTYLYLKNVIGLILLLLAIYLLEKKKFTPLVLMFAGLGIYHRPEFLLFSLILIPYFIRAGKKEIILVVVATALLIAPFWIPRLEYNLPMIHGLFNAAVTNIQTSEPSGGGGTFFGFETYEWVSLAYLPFGLIGLIYVLLKKKWSGLLYGFLINSAIVVFQLFFFKRLIISLDLLLIILAGAGLNYGFLESKLISKKLGIAVVVLLLISSGIILTDQVTHVRPLISDEQLQTIEQMAYNTEPDAYIFATSYDAPWVLGWSDREVIAPGLFNYRMYTKSEWLRFLGTKDVEFSNEILSAWDDPVYIYYSVNYLNRFELEKFEKSNATLLCNNESVIYQILPPVGLT
ncbi:MAG: hypothetical protein K8R25_02665 [Methanosarcinales archaeon]|nr:hypothetical protein [Methanosarcinales archaeon]